MSDPDEGAQDVPEGPDAGYAGAPDADPADAEIPDAEIPDAEIPDADIPESLYAEPVIPDPIIPPAPEGLDDLLPKSKPGLTSRSGNRSNWSADLDRPHTTRAALRAAASAEPDGATAPASDPNLTAPDPGPDVVPPVTGATSGGYRAATAVIYLFLLALLVGAIVTIAVLIGNGSTPFAAAMVPMLGLRV